MMVAMNPDTDQGKGLPFAKGHGTGNDFVLVPDPDGTLVLGSALVAWLCDRRQGLGGDGLLRVVRTAAVPEVAARAGEAEWFMDYRNRDGSLAEMCGNGVRVYARYLVESGLARRGPVSILTRAGVVVAEVDEAEVSVDMPMPRRYGRSVARLAGREYQGTVVSSGNPNLVCPVDDPATLDLTGAPALDPATFPAGANVEFVGPTGPGPRVAMRVVERGVGETLSCGSGACAVAAVVLSEAGQPAGTVQVDVPGGRLRVRIDNQRCVLIGPAVIVATGRLNA
jgi:diaminopimelate epimerase